MPILYFMLMTPIRLSLLVNPEHLHLLFGSITKLLVLTGSGMVCCSVKYHLHVQE